jgi:hypothetical protein
MLVRPVARLAVRPADDATEGSANLLVGFCLKGNEFKPNHVYEIQDILGELVIKDLGPSINASAIPPDSAWNHTVSEIVTTFKHRVMLTVPEWEAECEKWKNPRD